MTPTVPLAALLAHPALAGIAVLGDGGPGAQDTGIGKVAAVTNIADLGPADAALLIILAAPGPADWQADALVRRVHAAGAAALVLPNTDPLPRSTALLSARLGLPIYGTTDPFTIGAVARELIAAESTYTTTTLMVASHAINRGSTDVEHLIGRLSRALRRPIHLLDEAGRQLDRSTSPPIVVDPDAAQQRLRNSPGPQVLPLSPGMQLVAVPVQVGDGAPTWLSTPVPTRLPAETNAITAALEVAAHAVSYRLALDRLTDERDARLRAALLAELLDAGDTPSPELRRRTMHAGWRLEGWHIGIRVNPRTPIDTVARRAEILDALREQSVPGQAVEQADGWAAWTSLDDEPAPADIDRIATAIRRAQHTLADTLKTSVGVGRAHPGPGGLGRSLAEANDAAKLAESRPAAGRFVHIDKLGLANLLLAWTRTDTFLPAARTLLAPLDDQPGDLLNTLTAYLDAESSLVDTAAVLGIHRNTVVARITRIERLLNVRLTDPETRLALHLACRTRESGQW
jgi:hypothetical protein